MEDSGKVFTVAHSLKKANDAVVLPNPFDPVRPWEYFSEKFKPLAMEVSILWWWHGIGW